MITAKFLDGPLKGEERVMPERQRELLVALPTEFKVSELSVAPELYTRVPVGIYRIARYTHEGYVVEYEFRGVRA